MTIRPVLGERKGKMPSARLDNTAYGECSAPVRFGAEPSWGRFKLWCSEREGLSRLGVVLNLSPSGKWQRSMARVPGWGVPDGHLCATENAAGGGPPPPLAGFEPPPFPRP